MSVAFPNARDESRNGGRQPYGVGFGEDFASYRADLKQQLALLFATERGEVKGVVTAADLTKAESFISDDFESKSGCTEQYQAPTVSDASIFGNDVINPYAGFCRDDDIVHASYKKDGNEHMYGTGRVYSEIYDTKQQVMYMQFGIPKYRNLRTYLANAADSDMSDLNDGADSSMVGKLGSLIKDGIILAIKLPWLPLEWGYKLIDGLSDTKVTEYFYFKETMMLYYRHVNTILAHLAVGMGLFMTDEKTDANMPQILKGGPDIFKILSTRSERYAAKEIKTTDDLLSGSLRSDPPTEEKSWWTTVTDWISGLWRSTWSGVQTSVLDSNKFLAFRVEKGSDNASETFSNSTQESSLQQRLNGMVSQQRAINLGPDTSGNDLLSWANRQTARAGALINNVKNMFSGGKEGVANVIAYMAAGNGYFDLPQQWSGSNFSRSASVSVRLRSKTGGDPVSIYTSIMIPLACLIAGAIPRAAGDGTYTSPFIVRAWCRGMFAIPAGIIQSLSITRGDSEFGWTLTRLPTTVSINMQIADLSPILFLGLAGEGAWQQAFANNTKLQEYLNTIAGIGLKQRYYITQQLKRNAKVWALIHKSTTLSPTYWGMRLGDTAIGRIASACCSVQAMRVGSN